MPLTKLFVIIALLVPVISYIIWDIFLATNAVKGDTISEVVLFYAKRSLFLPTTLGVLLGHFFWPIYNNHLHNRLPGWAIVTILVTLGLFGIGFDIMNALRGLSNGSAFLTFLLKWPIILALFGILVGHFVWGQKI